MVKFKNKIAFALVSLLICSRVYSATMEVFPADLRDNKTIYTIGKELNKVHFILYSDRACGSKPGRHKVDGLGDDINMSVINFSVDIPEQIDYVGIVNMRENDFSKHDEAKEIVSKDGVFNRYTVSLDNSRIIRRVINGAYRYDIFLWLDMPKSYDGKIRWRLIKDGKVLVDAENKLKTVGVLPRKTYLPKDFILYVSYPDTDVPQSIADRRILFYKKMGVTHMAAVYSGDGLTDRRKAYFKKIKDAGIKVVLQRGGSFNSINKPIRNALKNGQGLYLAAQRSYNKIVSNTSKSELQNVNEFADAGILDYEASSSIKYPGYDDQETILAFSQMEGITKKITKKDLQGEYKNRYFKFRNKLICTPINAVSDLFKSENPEMKFFMEQGKGVPIGNNLDYKLYDDVVSYHCPMIYTNSLSFYQSVEKAKKYIGKDKLVPTNCAGFAANDTKVLFRKELGWLGLDYIGVASLGCAGIKHWPGMNYFDDGQAYEFVKASSALAKVEDFYQKGNDDKKIKAIGLAYINKKVILPGKVLDMSKPRWDNYLQIKYKKYEDESLVTILNYHPSEDAYIKISCNTDSETYLKNIRTGNYLVVKKNIKISSQDMRNGVVVKVNSRDYGLWVLSYEPPDDYYYTVIDTEVLSEFKKRKLEFNKQSPDVELGKKGDIEVLYQKIKTQNNIENCLTIKTPHQKISIKNSGGIIWQWLVDNTELVLRDGDINTGVGMDLLWYPKSFRDTGDELNEMQLSKCINNGKEVRLVYEQELKRSMPNVILIKTYRIKSNGTGIEVSVAFRNNTAKSLDLAYRSRSVFGDNAKQASRTFIVDDLGGAKALAYSVKEYSYSNRKVNPKFNKLLSDGAVDNSVGNVFGEYFTDEEMGVYLVLPNDFMQIYRLADKGVGSMEWMSCPVKINPDESYVFRYNIYAVKSENINEFKEKINMYKGVKVFNESIASSGANVFFKYNINLENNNNDNLPDLFNFKSESKNVDFNIEMDSDGKTPMMVFDCKAGSAIVLGTKAHKFDVPPGKSYVFTYQIKVDNLKSDGKWPVGIISYLFGPRKKYKWMGITGAGSTDGWITAMMSFDTKQKSAPSETYIRFNCNNITGKVRIKNISVLEVVDDVANQGDYYILKDGKQIDGGLLRL